MTKYEKAVYDIVSRSMEHLTVEQIFRRARDSYPRVALATIYNNVNKLWEAGLIRRVSLEGMPDRYDRVKRHDFADLTAPLREAAGEAFLYYDLKVFYLCPDCKKGIKNGSDT